MENISFGKIDVLFRMWKCGVNMLKLPIDDHAVRLLFEKKPRHLEVDFLYREIANRMYEKLSLIKLNPKYVLDLGCGTGADLLKLGAHFKEATVVGLDGAYTRIAEAKYRYQKSLSWLEKWRGRWGSTLRGPRFISGDMMQLPIATQSVEMIWSNLALHWCSTPQSLLAEWKRVLKPEGLFMFACFGPDTCREIKKAFLEIDEAEHALPFIDMHDWGDMLVEAGFSTPVMDMEVVTVTYSSKEQLFKELRAMGGNPLLHRRRGLMGRHAWDKVLKKLGELCDEEGKTPLTFEIVYGHAFRPISRVTKNGDAIVHFQPKLTGI